MCDCMNSRKEGDTMFVSGDVQECLLRLRRHLMQRLRLTTVHVDRGGTYLGSCCGSKFDPGDDWGFSSSPPDESATTLRLRTGGVRAAAFVRAANLGSCCCLVRRSSASSSLGVESPSRSESSSTLCRGGDRTLLSLDPLRFGILSLGARQLTKPSHRTYKQHHKSSQPLIGNPHWTNCQYCNWVWEEATIKPLSICHLQVSPDTTNCYSDWQEAAD